MEDFVHRANIDHFKKRLREAPDSKKRKLLEELLAAEEKELNGGPHDRPSSSTTD